MTERKEIKRQTFDLTIPDFFMLNSTNKLKGYDRYKHEVAGGDLFTAFHPYISAWSFEPPIGKDRGDRGIKIQDKIIYFEVDRCTEGLKTIDEKIDNYIQHSRHERFYLVFSLVGDEQKVHNRGDNLIKLLASRKRGNQFLIANHTNLINDPLGNVLFSPKDEILSIGALE